jgi:hypothetical protein
MAIQYTWVFPQLEVVYDEDGMQNVVNIINWKLIAQDGQYTASCYGTQRVGKPDPQAFIPYQQLTQAEVQSWTEQAMGQTEVDNYKFVLAERIEEQKNPKEGPLPPPWSA